MSVTASRLTRVELDAQRTIMSGETFRMDSILVCNASAAPTVVTFTNVASTVILTIAVLANSTFQWDVSFVVDGGLIIGSLGDSLVSVTLAHSAPGV